MNTERITSADRFLDAFARIEHGLRRLSKARTQASFGSLVAEASRSSAAVRAIRDDLQEFAELRNAIVHERGKVYPIADPHPMTVQRIEQLDVIVNAPPTISRLLPMKVVVCPLGDRIGSAARLMFKGEFSQMPVYEKSSYAGLLTAETIARWVADQFTAELDLMEERLVADIIGYRTKDSKEAFVARTITLAEVIEIFDTTTHRGESLDAVLVTQRGKKDERPLGILTVFDLPRLLRAAAIRH